MTNKAIALQVHAQKSIEQLLTDRKEKGQGALEYVGMMLVAAAVVLALVTAAKSWDFGQVVKKAIDNVMGK